MKRMTKLSLIVGSALLLCAPAVSAQSSTQESGKATQPPHFRESLTVTAAPFEAHMNEYLLTFSGPVAIPGAALAPGTYVFRFPGLDGKVIQVLKADGTTPYSMFETIPVVDVSRGLFTQGNEVKWEAQTAGAPPAIKEWFPPGKMLGYEFVYPNATS
jgi:hypothetical protein